MSKGYFKDIGWDINTQHCYGKKCYDKKSAQTARNQRHRDSGIELRIYPCPICNHFHLTKKVNGIKYKYVKNKTTQSKDIKGFNSKRYSEDS
jgi:hypothetical protein